MCHNQRFHFICGSSARAGSSVSDRKATRYYRAEPAAFGELRAYMESYWKDHLTRLKDEAEIEARRQRRRGK